MLAKLLKYDFKWINKVMYIYFIVLFIITILVKIVENLKQTILIVIIDKALSAMFISCIVSVIITCIMRIWARFRQNIYKDESYLTHTLPVTKSQIFNAKIIASILSLMLSLIVVSICIAITYLNSVTIDGLKVMYQSLVDAYNGVFAVFFIIGIVILISLEFIYFMMAGIFGIVIGHRSNNHKTILSIVAGIISYNLLSGILVIILGAASMLTNLDDIVNGFPPVNTVKVMGLVAIAAYAGYFLLYYFVSKKLLEKGVNVD